MRKRALVLAAGALSATALAGSTAAPAQASCGSAPYIVAQVLLDGTGVRNPVPTCIESTPCAVGNTVRGVGGLHKYIPPFNCVEFAR